MSFRIIPGMELHERIRKLRRALGLSQEELGAKVGVTGRAVEQWELPPENPRHTAPRQKRLDALAKALHTTKGALLGIETDVAPAATPRAEVPLISWVQAGAFHEPIELYEPGVAEDWYPVRKNVSPGSFALTVVGDSMVAPFGPNTYPPGTILVIDPEVEAVPGRRVIARHQASGEVTFKELASDAGKMYLKPLNPQYPTIHIDSEWEILGVVVSIHRDEM